MDAGPVVIEFYGYEMKRPCYDDEGATCECDGGRCYWCAPPGSPFFCQEYTDEPPYGLIGSDPEWRGPIEGPKGMMARWV